MNEPLHAALISMHTNPISQPGTGDAGGMNVYVHQLALGLADKGAQVEIFTRTTSDGDNQPKEVAPGVRLWPVPVGSDNLQKGDLTEIIPEFAHQIQTIITDKLQSKVDVIHSHYWLSGMAGLALRHHLAIPLVHSMHTTAKVKNARLAPGDTPESAQRLIGEQQIVAQADALMAATNQEQLDLVNRYGADKAKIQVIYPGVDNLIFHPGINKTAARQALGIQSALCSNKQKPEQIVLFAGRVQRLKAPDVLINALKWLPENVRLIIVGGPSGDTKIIPELTELAEKLGVAKRVQFIGPVPPTELANWFRAADVVAVPSYNETFGLVAAEAIACGTPVVGANVGGLREIIDDGVTGLLVSSYDGRAWAAALGQILHDAETQTRMAAAATSQARRFTWEQTAAQTLAGYQIVRATDYA